MYVQYSQIKIYGVNHCSVNRNTTVSSLHTHDEVHAELTCDDGNVDGHFF